MFGFSECLLRQQNATFFLHFSAPTAASDTQIQVGILAVRGSQRQRASRVCVCNARQLYQGESSWRVHRIAVTYVTHSLTQLRPLSTAQLVQLSYHSCIPLSPHLSSTSLFHFCFSTRLHPLAHSAFSSDCTATVTNINSTHNSPPKRISVAYRRPVANRFSSCRADP